jgi:hypothetical protein
VPDQRYTHLVRAGLVLLSCLILSTHASAQLAIIDAPAPPTRIAPDALVVSGDPASCLVPSTLSLAAISQTGSSIEVASRRTDACRWVVRGMDPGAYEIGLTHARGSGGRIRFDYVRGQTTEVRIPAPTVRVAGVVRINGERVPGAQIMFTTRLVQSGLPKVVTNQDGLFEATLPEAGAVNMRLSGNDVYGRIVGVTFSEGANRFDWTITGGTLVIRDARGPRPEGVTIAVWYESGLQGWAASLFPAGRELRGAPFGTHRVAIKRGPAPEETITSVTISPDAPRAEAVIDVP